LEAEYNEEEEEDLEPSFVWAMRIAVTKHGEEANEEAEVWKLSGEKA